MGASGAEEKQFEAPGIRVDVVGDGIAIRNDTCALEPSVAAPVFDASDGEGSPGEVEFNEDPKERERWKSCIPPRSRDAGGRVGKGGVIAG